MTIGEKVLAFLKANGFSQDGFRHVVSWPKTSFNELCAGKKDASFHRVYNLCAQMGCDLDYLVDTSKSWPPPVQPKEVRALSQEELKILSYAQDLGYQTAMSRLLNLAGERVPLKPPGPDESGPIGRKRTGG